MPKLLIFLVGTGRKTMNKAGNTTHICADTVPDRSRLESLLRIAAEQWPHKSAEDQAHERWFIERDLSAYEALRNG